MRRIYIYDFQKNGERILISGETSHYIKNVLRLTRGSTFFAFDGSGTEYKLEILDIKGLDITARIIDQNTVRQKELKIPIELCIGICKTKTFENVIKKAAEIGITRIIPFISTRSTLHIDDKKVVQKIERWKKIAAEGSKIAGRSEIPEIFLPAEYDKLIREKRYGIIFWEKSSEGLKNIIDRILRELPEYNCLSVFIGPEGGFTEEEISMAKSNGILVASLGSRILSVETAAIVACSILIYEIENLKISQ